MPEIKARAAAAGLSQTGKRFDIVLRLLQHASGIGEPKRVPGSVGADGEFVPAPKKTRAPSMKVGCHGAIRGTNMALVMRYVPLLALVLSLLACVLRFAAFHIDA